MFYCIKNWKSTGLWIGGLILLLRVSSGHSQTVELQVHAPQIWKIDDDAKFFEVHLRNDRPVRALQFTLAYDPAVITGVSSTGEHRTTGLFEHRLHAEAGHLSLLQVDFKNRALNAGTGSIAAFQFRSEKSGSVQVRFVEAVVVGPSGETLPVRLTSGTVQVTDDPNRLRWLTPNNLTRSPGSPLGQPVQVEVRDRFDNPVPGVVVQFRVATGGGRLSSSRDTTDAQGRASVEFTLGSSPGINSVVAQVPGLPNLNLTLTVIGSQATTTEPATEGVLTLKRGYNLIGLPVRPQTPLTAKGFLGLLQQMVSLTRFQNATSTFEDVFRAGTRILGTDFSLEVGAGYFAQMSEAVDYTLAGQTLDIPATLSLKRGYNLVSMPYQGLNLTAFTLLRSTPQAVAISRFDAGTQGFDNALRAGTRFLGSDFPLRLGEGYFVQVSEDVVLLGGSGKPTFQEETGTETALPAFRVKGALLAAGNPTDPPPVAGPPGQPHLVFGRVEDARGQPVEGMPIALIIEGQEASLPLWASTDQEGWWIVNLAEARAALQPAQAFHWSAGDRLLLRLGEIAQEVGTIVPGGPQFLAPQRAAQAQAPTLARLYPNPFNSQITIELRLPASRGQEAPTVKIFNLSGQLVKVLELPGRTGGTYRIAWDGTDGAGKPVGSGVYFVRLEAGHYAVVRKILLLQ